MPVAINVVVGVYKHYGKASRFTYVHTCKIPVEWATMRTSRTCMQYIHIHMK
jgi:hypothetical protein